MKKILTVSLLMSVMLFAEFKVGDTFPTLHLSDQFEKQTDVTNKIQYILMAFEKDVSVETADFFKKQMKGFLEKRHLLYISDISSMPSFITSMFALPKMKKYPFSVLLINDDRGEQFNKKEGVLTRYSLKHHKITAIDFLSPKQLRRDLK